MTKKLACIVFALTLLNCSSFAQQVLGFAVLTNQGTEESFAKAIGKIPYENGSVQLSEVEKALKPFDALLQYDPLTKVVVVLDRQIDQLRRLRAQSTLYKALAVSNAGRGTIDFAELSLQERSDILALWGGSRGMNDSPKARFMVVPSVTVSIQGKEESASEFMPILPPNVTRREFRWLHDSPPAIPAEGQRGKIPNIELRSTLTAFFGAAKSRPASHSKVLVNMLGAEVEVLEDSLLKGQEDLLGRILTDAGAGELAKMRKGGIRPEELTAEEWKTLEETLEGSGLAAKFKDRAALRQFLTDAVSIEVKVGLLLVGSSNPEKRGTTAKQIAVVGS